MADRLDRADGQQGQQGEGHVGAAEVLDHVGGESEGQALSTLFDRTGNRVPALLDEGAIGLGKAVRQRDRAIGQLRAFLVALAVERRPFPGGELADPFDDGPDHVLAGAGEAFVLREFGDSGVDADGGDLVGSGCGEIHGALSLGFAANRL